MIDWIGTVGSFLSGAGVWLQLRQENKETAANKKLIEMLKYLSDNLFKTKNIHRFYQEFYYTQYKGFLAQNRDQQMQDWKQVYKYFKITYQKYEVGMIVDIEDMRDRKIVEKELSTSLNKIKEDNKSTVSSLSIDRHIEIFSHALPAMIGNMILSNQRIHEFNKEVHKNNLQGHLLDEVDDCLSSVLTQADICLIQLIEIQENTISKLK